MTTYIWDGKEVIEDIYGEPRLGKYVYSPDWLGCKWHLMLGTRRHPVWAERSKSEMPKEFLTQLLLLGVPT